MFVKETDINTAEEIQNQKITNLADDESLLKYIAIRNNEGGIRSNEGSAYWRNDSRKMSKMRAAMTLPI